MIEIGGWEFLTILVSLPFVALVIVGIAGIIAEVIVEFFKTLREVFG